LVRTPGAAREVLAEGLAGFDIITVVSLRLQLVLEATPSDDTPLTQPLEQNSIHKLVVHTFFQRLRNYRTIAMKHSIILERQVKPIMCGGLAKAY
jgi:hypothetical protein